MISDYNSFADIYNDFRLSGEFFYSFEYPIVKSIIENIFSKIDTDINILDVGCGTSLWYELIYRLSIQKNKKINYFGIDNSIDMLNIAKNNYPFLSFYKTSADRIIYNKKFLKKFNFIFFGLSADYIGIKNSLSLIENTLSTNGISLIWLFDPRRYKSIDGFHLKNWYFDKKNIQFLVEDFNPDLLSNDLSNNFKYNYTLKLNLPIKSNIRRKLYFYVSSNKYTMPFSLLQKLSNKYNIEPNKSLNTEFATRGMISAGEKIGGK